MGFHLRSTQRLSISTLRLSLSLSCSMRKEKKSNKKPIQGEQQNDQDNQKDGGETANGGEADGGGETANGGEADGSGVASERAVEDDGGVVTVVFKVDLCCKASETEIKDLLRRIEGVVRVERSDEDSNELRVIGKVDPAELRQMLEKKSQKTKKKVELVSPQPNKFKEIPATTAVMRLNLDCGVCIQKLRKAVAKTKALHQ